MSELWNSLTIERQERIKINYTKLRNYLSHNQIKLRKEIKKGEGLDVYKLSVIKIVTVM